MDTSEDIDEQTSQLSECPGENTLRVMLSTDNHLGYNERDPVRGMDSFAAFEEIMYLAKKFQCDIVLLSGDLFHENRPSRPTLFKTIEILRRYCMGDNPVRVQILSDPAQTFASNNVANYQDPNYSVDLPIFSIHGNHDDPVRDGQGTSLLAALDLLAVSNLVNYIGKQEKIDEVEISPVLLKKGSTHVALFSLGSMRDERLNRMWNSKKVRFLRPVEDSQTGSNDDDEENEKGFFNIFTLHQNRDLGRGKKNCVQETMIPEWMDMVVWGHEHECLIDLFESVVGTFRICQPGSSVATSLVAGEAVRKKIGILDIQGKQFRVIPVPLTQVRPFVTTDISLREHREQLDPEDPRINEQLSSVLQEEVKVLTLNALDRRKEALSVARAMGNDAGDDGSAIACKLEKPDQPLVRLRVEHSGFSTLNNQRFGAHFVGRVANPEDILLFHRKKDPSQTTRRTNKKTNAPLAPEELVKDIEDLVNGLLEAPESKLKLFSEKYMSEALGDFVEKKAVLSIDEAADKMLNKRQKALLHRQPEEPAPNQSINDSMESTTARSTTRTTDKENDRSQADVEVPSRKRALKRTIDDFDEEEGATPNTRKTGRGKRPQEPSSNSQNKASKRQLVVESDEGIDEAPTKRTNTRRTARKKPVNYSIDEDKDDFDSDDPEVVPEMDVNEEDDMLDDGSEDLPRSRKRKQVAAPSNSRTKKAGISTRKRSQAARSTSRARYDDSEGEDDLRKSAIDLEDEDEDWGTVNR